MTDQKNSLFEPVDEFWMPKKFSHRILKYDKHKNGFEAIVRINATTKSELHEWKNEFEKLSKTKWIVRRTYPNLQRMAFRINYVCQHGSFNKHTTKRATKNTGCGAKMSLKLNKVTRGTKNKNGFIKCGFPAVAQIYNIHNHSVNTTAALLFLPATAECRQQFHDYFASGMSISEAMKYHTSMLELQEGASAVAKLMNASINPKYSTVRWWYSQWRLHNTGPGPRSGHLDIQATRAELDMQIADSAEEEELDFHSALGERNSGAADGPDAEIVATESCTLFDSVIGLMCELNSRFKHTRGAKKIFLERLNLVRTAAQWETFLGCSRNCSGVYRRPSKLPSREQLLVGDETMTEGDVTY